MRTGVIIISRLVGLLLLILAAFCLVVARNADDSLIESKPILSKGYYYRSFSLDFVVNWVEPIVLSDHERTAGEHEKAARKAIVILNITGALASIAFIFWILYLRIQPKPNPDAAKPNSDWTPSKSK